MRRLLASILILGASGAGWLGSAQAQQSCNAPAGTFDRVYCDAKLLIRADDELNVTYQKLLKRLTPQAQQTLRQTQRNWMKERDSTCVDVDPRWGSVVYSDCAARKTADRLNFLNDRLRECLSTGCQPSKLR
ncbi:hypothetical protein GCM10017784_27440 [Deinococcus indicus]|uniref:lysozyme inhibitor LprI family protein n=1 Tax=Deinococcus indicus TaxID=223556 RepID=UPI00174C75AE|nr:lysozyme inhibitor LprI family protein [Deinococcus indicus]GHG32370.1 hypothetical protein GCM10017784_27440 [Deinococcus indicus]